MNRVLLAAALACAAVGGCKRAEKKLNVEEQAPRTGSVYHLHRFIPVTLRVRRPPGEGANPKAGPGGEDYVAHPLPDARFDCKPVAALFEGLKLDDVRACIASIKSAHASYALKRAAVPSLELEADGDTPACLQASLASIPVPRELFFQSNEGDRLACYSSRLQIEANEVVGFKMPIDRQAVRLDFPMATRPKDDDETSMLLMSWVLTPFWEKTGSTLPAHLVPDAICARCLGERDMIKPGDPEPVTWPD